MPRARRLLLLLPFPGAVALLIAVLALLGLPLVRLARLTAWDWFLCGFCSHLSLLAVLVLLGAVVRGRIGRAYGLHHLLWHEHRHKQFFLGVVLSLLAAQVLLVGFLLDAGSDAAHASFAESFGAALPPADDGRGGRSYVPWMLAFYVLGVLLPGAALGWARGAAAVAGRGEESADDLPSGAPLALGGAVGALIAGWGLFALPRWFEADGLALLHQTGDAMVDFVARLHGALDAVSSDAERLVGKAPVPPRMKPLHAVSLWGGILSCGLFAALAVAKPLRRRITPLLALCLLVSVGVAAAGFVEFHFPRYRVLAALAVAGLVVLGGRPRFKLRFPHLDDLYREPRDVDEYYREVAHPAQPPHFRREPLQRRGVPWPTGQRRPLAVVCVSGGGIRAAAWTVAVLNALEEAFERDAELRAWGVGFPYQVALITGASGGMVGAAYHTATLHSPVDAAALGCCHSDRDARGLRTPLNRAEMQRRIMADCLSPVVARLVFNDLPGLVWPFPYRFDRGRQLELTWRETLHGALEQTFAQMRPGEAAGWRPSLVFSPMVIEGGRRLLISNLDLDELTVNRSYVSRRRPDPGPASTLEDLSRSAAEFFRMFGDRPSFPLATAARMSASFPLISPAVSLPTDPPRRVVDAGYYDNDGVCVASAWLFHNRDWLEAVGCNGVALIQVRDSLSEASRMGRSDVVAAAATAAGRALEGLSSPLHAVLAAREASMSYRNDEGLELLGRVSQRFGDQAFTTAAFEYGGGASLNWYLSSGEQDDIRGRGAALLAPGAEGQARVAGLIDWWKDRLRAGAVATGRRLNAA